MVAGRVQTTSARIPPPARVSCRGDSRLSGSDLSSAAALYFAHRDWISAGPHESLDALRAVTIDVLQNIHKVLESRHPSPALIDRVYAGFSRVSECNERLRANGGSSSEMARAHEYAHALGSHVYGVILVSLDKIQDAMENPFDAIGEDDIVLDAVADYQRITSTTTTHELAHASALIEGG